MGKWLARALCGFGAVAVVLMPLAGCQGETTPASSTGAAVTTETAPLTTYIPPTTTQSTITFIPPATTTTSLVISSLPPPVSITTSTTPVITTTEPPTTTSEAPTTTVIPTTTEPPTTTVILPPEDGQELEMSDGQGDLFDASGTPVEAGDYLDITGAEVYISEAQYFFRLNLKGPLTQAPEDAAVALEWDFFIDTDANQTTGWVSPLMANDIGPDYLLRLIIQAGRASAELYDVKTGEASPVYYRLLDTTLDFSFTPQTLELGDFDVVAASRQWYDGQLVAADKAPDQGHYNLSEGYVYIKPGLPDQRYDSLHAIFWYNEGNEERAPLVRRGLRCGLRIHRRFVGPVPDHQPGLCLRHPGIII
jgi:hypothetical protein